jgi:hypothetical protein
VSTNKTCCVIDSELDAVKLLTVLFLGVISDLPAVAVGDIKRRTGLINCMLIGRKFRIR